MAFNFTPDALNQTATLNYFEALGTELWTDIWLNEYDGEFTHVAL